MTMRFAFAALFTGLCTGTVPSLVHADVVILSNRTAREVRFTLLPPQGPLQDLVIPPSEVRPFPVVGSVGIRFVAGKLQRQYQLDPNGVYYFADFPDGLNLEEIRLGGAVHAVPEFSGKAADSPARTPPGAGVPGKIAVKILVDEEEPATQRVWEERLRKRLAAASDILERHCQVRFEVVAVGTWQSANGLADFEELLQDFEGNVSPRPARLAIGFTSQHAAVNLQGHLGGTRGALHSHILVREWWPRTEPERLEVLVHELGHYLGAVHSPEPDSVMRPKLGDGKALLRKFRIGFDPANTLVMYLVGEELRRGARSLPGMSARTRERLRQVYTDLARAVPDDPTAARYVGLLEQQAPAPRPAAVQGPAPLVEATRKVLAALVTAAEENQRLPLSSAAAAGGPHRLTGDALTGHYFRATAAAARQLPEDQAAAAYLLALGIGLDPSGWLRRNPATSELCRRIETDAERDRRLAVLGLPTMRGRHDLTLHFTLSAALTVLIGPKGAEAAGILKEQLDAQGGSGFSFADLAADMAGIVFAEQFRGSKTVLPRLATSFAVSDYLPDLAGLREGLNRAEFDEEYGSVTGERFQAEQAAIWKRIRALPGYK
jgi:hypothetical protein